MIYRKLSALLNTLVGLTESRQYRCFLKRNVFRLDLKEGRLGEGIPGHTLSILVEFEAWNSHETSVCRTQRAGRLIDREKIR